MGLTMDGGLMDRFCVECFANRELKEIVRRMGSMVDECTVCGSKNVPSLESSNPVLREVVRALIRINYSEFDYNTHLGGESLSTILFGVNAIFDLPNGASEENFESAFYSIEDNWYPPSDDEIRLGGGYWDGGILLSLSKFQHDRVYDLALAALSRNSHELLKEAVAIFKQVSPLVNETIEPSSTWYRARIGFQRKYRSVVGFWGMDYAYEPYSEGAVGAPPPHVASEGRLNRHRNSMLYLATDELTAISEVRPHPGHILTVGEFRASRNIVVANLASPRLESFAKDRLLDLLHMAISLGVFANLPVTPETRHWYMATQLIGDAARVAGFDGIMFRSTVSDGINLVVFDPSSFGAAHEVRPVEVRALSYQIASVPSSIGIDMDEYELDEDEFLFNEMLSRSRK